MSERKVRVPLPGTGQIVDGMEVPVENATERWSEIKLEDGTIFRVKTVVAGAVRVDGQYDQEGNPLYLVKSTAAVAIISVPEGLRKKLQ